MNIITLLGWCRFEVDGVHKTSRSSRVHEAKFLSKIQKSIILSLMFHFFSHCPFCLSMQDTESDIEKHETQFGDLRKIATAYKTELKAADESTEMIDKALQRWDERWNELNSMLNTTKKKVCLPGVRLCLLLQLANKQKIKITVISYCIGENVLLSGISIFELAKYYPCYLRIPQTVSF